MYWLDPLHYTIEGICDDDDDNDDDGDHDGHDYDDDDDNKVHKNKYFMLVKLYEAISKSEFSYRHRGDSVPW